METKEQLDKQELERKDLIKRFLVKLANFTKNVKILNNDMETTYEELLEIENEAVTLADNLGVEYNKRVSTTNIKQNIDFIKQKIKDIQEKANGVVIGEDTPLEDVLKYSSKLTKLLDGVSHGIMITTDLELIVKLFRTQSNNDIKRQLYFKTQDTIQNVKMERYLSKQQEINETKVGIFGKLIGKDKLKAEQLRNVDLKIKLSQIEPQEQEKYDIDEILADISFAIITEFNGNTPKDLAVILSNIKENFKRNSKESYSDEYIKQLGMNRTRKANEVNGLPVPSTKKPRLFGTNRFQIKVLQLENNKMQNQLYYSQMKKGTLPKAEQAALPLFEQKLNVIKNELMGDIEAGRDRKEIQQGEEK